MADEDAYWQGGRAASPDTEAYWVGGRVKPATKPVVIPPPAPGVKAMIGGMYLVFPIP